MARNQQDSNDRLEIDGFDYVVRKDSSWETVDGAKIDFVGNVLLNGTPLGSVGGVTGYVHTQGTPSVTWTINHNLGYFPVVDVFTSGGLKIVAQVDNVSINQTIVTVSPALAGYARMI